MKYKVLIVFYLILLCGHSYGKENFGLGAILGAPTGISGNYKLSEKNSVDFAIAFLLSSADSDKFYTHGTYLWHKPKSLKVFGQVLGWYYGLGARTRYLESDDDNFKLAARGSLGALWDFQNVPCDLFAESSVNVNFIPSTDVGLNLAIGARYYF